MIDIIFTSDYEIHGNGVGSPLKLMVEPTYRNIKLFDRYGAKLTIMADVAEILMFKKYLETNGSDDYYYEEIVAQLKDSVVRGHDVQLHIHPTYFDAKLNNNIWKQDAGSFILRNETFNSLYNIIKKTKDFLTSILTDAKKDYKCFVFRAGGWQMQPSKNITKALVANGIQIDSSVFKNGSRNGINKFDYFLAPHRLLPWPADENDICIPNINGKLIEFPIYTEQRYLTSFISLNRIYRLFAQTVSRLITPHPMIKKQVKAKKTEHETSIPQITKPVSNKCSRIKALFKRYPFKMDFNQCTGHQLIRGLLNAEHAYGDPNFDIPFVIIGHSKTFTKYNEKSLIPFLRFVRENPERFRFSLFSDIDLSKIRSIWNK